MSILTPAQSEKIAALAVDRLVEYTRSHNLHGYANGISGGINSTIIAKISQLAAAKLRSEGYEMSDRYIYIGIQSNPADLAKARELAKAWNFTLEEHDLTNWYLSSPIFADIPKDSPDAKVQMANLKCRLRMILLSQKAKQAGGVYLDTDDLIEDLLGFFTVRGDCGDVKILQLLSKLESYDLGRFFKAPESILKSKPGDGLGVTPTSAASDQLGLEYVYIEYILSRFLGEGFDHLGEKEQLANPKFKDLISTVAKEAGVTKDQINKIFDQVLKTTFKRSSGYGVPLLITSRTEMGLPEIGSTEFSVLALKAIQSLR